MFKRKHYRNIGTTCAAISVFLSGGLLLSSCGSSHQSSSDPGGNPGTREAVLQMPYGFRNVAFSCHGTTGVYVTSRSVTATVELPSSIAVLANDPACK